MPQLSAALSHGADSRAYFGSMVAGFDTRRLILPRVGARYHIQGRRNACLGFACYVTRRLGWAPSWMSDEQQKPVREDSRSGAFCELALSVSQ